MDDYIMNRESLKRHCEVMCKKFKDVPTSGIYSEHRLVLDLLEQTEWIPVGEKLPEANRAVLTYIDIGATKTYCLAYWNDAYKAWEEWMGYCLIEKDRDYKVIAWMPLPEPYKAESEEQE